MNPVSATPRLPYPGADNTLAALSSFDRDLVRTLFNVFVEHARRINATLPKDGSEAMTAPIQLVSYTVANLPTATAGSVAYASNGRKNGEGAGAGTGVMVFRDGSNWIAADTGQTVAA